MAKVEYSAPIANASGAVLPGCVCRQKRYRVGGKSVLGPKEVFHKRKRDYKRKPFTEAEQHTVDRFRQAEALRKIEMANPERWGYWQNRFAAQAERPEPGNTKVYHRIEAFMRAMLMKEMQQP